MKSFIFDFGLTFLVKFDVNQNRGKDEEEVKVSKEIFVLVIKMENQNIISFAIQLRRGGHEF